MNTKTIKTLEFDKILNKLEQNCSTYLGRAICANTNISTNISEIEKRLKEVTQMESLILRFGALPISQINNVTNSLKKSKIGGILSFKELLDIAHILKQAREIKDGLYKEKDFIEEDYSLLIPYLKELYSNPKIEKLILDNIIDEETIEDKASKELSAIRKSIKQLEGKIKDVLNQYISNPTYSKYIQDNIVTIRNDRFVIPVKIEYKNNIKGLIHDTSSSGSTVFIEPSNVVEINNNIKEKHIEEKNEIERILKEYSNEIAQIADNIGDSIKALGYLDFVHAKANYAIENNMFEPNINQDKYINLKEARHPLIDKKKVVPISLEIDQTYNALIITGPNTGGKTVTLKTIGLLTLMTQYGMHIPTKSGSSICIFTNIFTDIGDEQSIEQNLSTFSSHMSNIVNITKNVTKNSLVIIDELGSGTDPVEGAALAQGILEYLINKKCLTICTTHYSELKTYAMSKDNILNACTEFNIKTLKPTYRLILGIPGKSNAFAISEKLGLNKEILDISSNYLTNNSVDFESLLSQMQAEKDEINKIKKNIQSEYSKIKTESEKYTKLSNELENKKDEILANAKYEAQQLLLNSKEEINDMLNEVYATKSMQPKDIQKKKTDINDKLNKKLSSLSSKEKTITEDVINIKDLKVGQTILVKSLNKEATIQKISKDKVNVQIGIIKTDITLDDIKLLDTKEKKKTANIKLNISNKAQNVSSTLNVMGMNLDVALMDIDKYLDDAILAKLAIVTILHGKGTGTLRKGIQDYLKKDKRVKSYRTGGYSEGQEGVTIVELK